MNPGSTDAADPLAWANPVTRMAMHCQDHPGDPDALPALLKAMAGMTQRAAKRWLRVIGRGGDMDDLMQAGRMGVMRAVATFDRGREVQFCTYAAHWIESLVGEWAGRQSTGTMPYHLANTVLGGRRTVGRYSAECVEAARRCCRPLSIDHEAMPLLRGREPESGLDCDERDRLLAAVSRLPDRMRRLLHLRYGLDGGEPMLLREAGAAAGGLSKEYARKLIGRGLEAMREELAEA